MIRILVLDANQRAALAIARSLGKCGHYIITADSTRNALAGHSRYSQEYQCYPDPLNDWRSFVEWLTDIIESKKVDLLIPVTDLTSTIVVDNENRLANLCTIPFTGKTRIELLGNKCNLVRFAQKMDTLCPESIFVDAGHSFPEPGDLQFPVVIKPASSIYKHEGNYFRSEVTVINDQQAYREFLQEAAHVIMQEVMIQQYIPGHGAAIFVLYDHGELLAYFSHRRLREKPPSGGVSVLSESMPVSSVLLESTRKLLDEVEWHGVAMVEYRVDESGRHWLMEVNTRFWGSLQLAIDAGVDFPKWLCQLSTGEVPNVTNSYREGTRLRWFLGDLDSLYLFLKKRDTGIMAKITRVLEFIFPLTGFSRHEVNRLDDFAPAIYEAKQYVKLLFNT